VIVVPSVSSQTVGAGVLLLPKPRPVIVTAVLPCESVPDVDAIHGDGEQEPPDGR
jgi:hypothetical protein